MKITDFYFVYHREAVEAIEQHLISAGFEPNENFTAYIKMDTGCEFSISCINSYDSLLDFQLDYPFYSNK